MSLRALLIVALLAFGLPVPASAAPSTLEFFVKRTLLPVPTAPAVGTGFVGGDELVDVVGAKVGDGDTFCGIVRVTTELPPSVVALCTSVYRLKDGQLHLSSLRTYRPVAMAFDDCPVAVIGGTGPYATARGDGTYTKLTDPDRAYKVSLTIS